MTTAHMSKTSESSLQDQLALLKTIIDAIDEGVLVVDRQSTFVMCNHQFLALWQIPAHLATDNQAMMKFVVEQVYEHEDFITKIIMINSNPEAEIRDEVLLKDDRVIERYSRPQPGSANRVWTFRDITERKRAQREAEERQEQIIRMQQAAIAELSTPLIPISRGVLVMPLIGAVDTVRAGRIMESILDGASQQGAHAVIIDITGVATVDTQVANALLQAAQAVRLLGAQAILTGIRPDVAQTLVSLGVDFASIITRGTLEDGIAYALATSKR